MRIKGKVALLPLLSLLLLTVAIAAPTESEQAGTLPAVTKSRAGLLPASIDLGAARRFNGFFFDAFVSPSSDTEGALAAGGNVDLNHYSVADRLPANFAGPSLLVGGDLTFPNGRVYRGDIIVGGSAEGVGQPVISGLGPDQQLLEHAALPFDFALQWMRLESTSRTLAALPPNGHAELQWGGLQLQGDCESSFQVFALDGPEVLAAHTFQVSCIPQGATVIFNIDGSHPGLSNMSLESLAGHRQRVLFNFHEAETLTLAGVAVQGSILAPNAHIEQPQGVVHGSVMSRSWDGPMQLNHVPFRVRRTRSSASPDR